MSDKEEKAMQQLSDQELAQAAGGAEIDGGSGGGGASVASTGVGMSWIDEEGVVHQGPMPGATTTAGSANSNPANWTPAPDFDADGTKN
jgi:hypothetical protein